MLTDPVEQLEMKQDDNYFGPALDITGGCRTTCHREVTVQVRLVGPAATASRAVDATIEMKLFASTTDLADKSMDIDLGLVNDANRAFNGAPTTTSARQTSHLHVAWDKPTAFGEVRITVDRGALRAPLAVPLVGEIAAGVQDEVAVGHPNAHGTTLTFISPTMRGDSQAPSNVVALLQDEQPAVLDLFSLCVADVDCVVYATLDSRYAPEVDGPGPSGEPPKGSIDFDWYIDVTILAYDGRPLPPEAIRIEPVP
jgi:hypothetical protein